MRCGGKEGSLFGMTLIKRFPDMLTLLRVVLAVALIWIALSGRADLARDIWLLVISWSTDMVDGWLSRKLKVDQTSWLGKNDVYVDMFVSTAALFYLAVSAYLPLWLVILYLVVWGGLFLWRGIPPLFAQVFQNPIYACFLFFAIQAAPNVLPWLLLWALIGLLFFWRRVVELYNETVRFLRR